MNLAYRYPIIYWNCACLSVDSSAITAQDFYNLIEEDIVSVEDVDGKKVQNKMDYAKIAAALDKFKSVCKIKLPDINLSRLGFTPNVNDNSILYGLKGITRITEPVITEIMGNRPFASLEDFLRKITKRVITKDKVINLIKCGAFDAIEAPLSRKEILQKYIWSICEPKKKLTMQNANMLIDLHLLPNELEYETDLYKLTKELRRHRDSEKMWYFTESLDIPYNKFEAYKVIVADSGVEGKDLIIDGEKHRVIDSKKWDVFYDKHMLKIKTYISKNHDALLEKLNNRLFSDEYYKYCTGDELQWELDSINFYFNGHPLRKVIPTIPDMIIHDVDTIIEGAQDGNFMIKGKIIPKMRLYRLAGTVIDKDKVKGLVTLQTPKGVVNVKIYKDLFSTLSATIGEITDDGEKEIDQEGFFEKGTHLLVTGIQRGVTFIPKTYKNTGHPAILKIVLDEEGEFVELEEKMDF